ncbi:AAA-like domain-containing protein [Thermoleptolyngbya sp. PKUAC-SCTB121]|uniref:AAA-like domain-containing protein n=1 Tax=Thermoleptolyngbya sp. PKUAC-SCTB121 TaxID=2811482 RepID=UPI001963B356|nr:AAA-like domain-containing protein [Thermoleptolyngbya sp. PKUAC-SCTB121]
MKRRRGVVLTHAGLKRLQAAIAAVEIAENDGERFTLEELGDRIRVSTKTLSRLWSLNSGIDRRTLHLCFSSFNLDLQSRDYVVVGDLAESEVAPGESPCPLPAQSPRTEIELGSSESSGSLSPPTHWPKASPRPAAAAVHPSNPSLSGALPYPDGPVPLDSPFYIDRPPIEALAYQEISQPGCVIRIRAPRGMGKTSLTLRLLTVAEAQGYRTVTLDCNQFDSALLNDLSKFLRSFCLRLAQALHIPPNLEDYWDEEIGSKLSCSFYLKTYLLKQIDAPVVLVLNEIDRFFEHTAFAQDFFPLLRSWYEESRRDLTLQKLRLVVVYSTEAYVALDINQSPFNIGLPLRLPEFSAEQVLNLAQRHGLPWGMDEVEQLIDLIGGHPGLVRMALYHICTYGLSLSQLVQGAIATGGIFRPHLWRHWVTIQQHPNLLAALRTVVLAECGQSVLLDPLQAYRLESRGLLRYEGDLQNNPCGNRVLSRCRLYHQYFRQQFMSESPLL